MEEHNIKHVCTAWQSHYIEIENLDKFKATGANRIFIIAKAEEYLNVTTTSR